jgi:hypothetical protein
MTQPKAIVLLTLLLKVASASAPRAGCMWAVMLLGATRLRLVATSSRLGPELQSLLAFLLRHLP